MKKIFCVLICFCVVFLAACGRNEMSRSLSPEDAVRQGENGTTLSAAPPVTELSPQINASTEIDTKGSEYPIDIKKSVIKGKYGGDTLSGLTPLSPVCYVTPLPGNGKAYSVEKQSHSHGPASGGQPHYTVVEFQKNFDSFGAVTLDTKSEKKVLYLTFDCGYEHDNLTSRVLDVLKEKKVTAAFFCTLDHIKKETEIISRMINEGHIVGNHSATHPSFASISRAQMTKELQDTENYLRENYGYASKFFRFPAGEYTQEALDTVAGLGYISVFWSVAYDDWNIEKVHGKDYATEKVISRLHDGAIILLHSVSKDNAEALGEIIDKARGQGYEFKSLSELPM